MPKVKDKDLRDVGFKPGAGNGWYLDHGDKRDQTHLHLRVDGSDWNGGYVIVGITVKIRDEQCGEIGYSGAFKRFSTRTLDGISGHEEAVQTFREAIEKLNKVLIKS